MVRGIAVAIAALGAAIIAPAAAWTHVGVSPTSAPAGKPLSLRSLPKPVKPAKPTSIVAALQADREE